MGESARGATDTSRPSSVCERCGAPAELDAGTALGALAQLRCTRCDHVVDVAMVPLASSPGRWTVIDPDAVVRHFSSWQELIGSLPLVATPLETSPGARSTRLSSAASLLDVTPSPSTALPRLSLVGADEPLRLPQVMPPRAPVEEPLSSSEPVESVEAVESLRDEDVVPASDDGRAALAHARAGRPVRTSAAPPLPVGASLRPPVVSLPPPPPAPKGGTLRTLPPPLRHESPAPPPPTIDVESDPVLPESPPSEPRSVRSVPSAPSVRSARSGDTKPSTPVSAALSARERGHEREARSGRGWLWPLVAVGVLVASVAYVMRGPSSPLSPPPPTPPEALAAAATGAATEPALAASSAPAATPASSEPAASAPSVSASAAPGAGASASAPSASSVPAAPSAAAEPERRGVVGDSQLTLPDVLQRAAAARKAGDARHAKALLERALELSPGNAEAHGLLADLARSQGDNAGAKASYEKALATSPGYFPALLGIADTEWDLGERDAAQRHYASIVSMGRTAPERVRERAGQAGQGSAPPPPTAAPPSPAAPEE